MPGPMDSMGSSGYSQPYYGDFQAQHHPAYYPDSDPQLQHQALFNQNLSFPNQNLTRPPADGYEIQPETKKVKTEPKNEPKSGKPSGPVKSACLTCRKKKAKCGGEQPHCLNCTKRGLTCEYVKSKRGGPRKKKDPDDIGSVNPLVQYFAMLEQIEHYGEVLDQNSDAWQTSSGPAFGVPGSLGDDLPGLDINLSPEHQLSMENIVMEYKSAEEIIQAYYEDIYTWMPVLPTAGQAPINDLVAFLSSSLSSSSTSSKSKWSPFFLACLTCLVLIPHPNDPNPQSSTSKHLRRRASQKFADECFEAIEGLVEKAGVELDQPLYLDSVMALILLAHWEYAAKGNMTKMRFRAGQALQVAMDMGLNDESVVGAGFNGFKNHESETEKLWKTEMGRRCWWMVYMGMMQGSIITGLLPSLSAFDPRITKKYPLCGADSEIWPRQINILRTLMDFNEMNHRSMSPHKVIADPLRQPSDGRKGDKQIFVQELYSLDKKLIRMLQETEDLASKPVKKGAEEELAANFQLSSFLMLAVAQVWLHRTIAFPEVAFFSTKMCGLPAQSDVSPSALLKQVAAATPKEDAKPTLDRNMSNSSGNEHSLAGSDTLQGFGLSELEEAPIQPDIVSPVYHSSSSTLVNTPLPPTLLQPKVQSLEPIWATSAEPYSESAYTSPSIASLPYTQQTSPPFSYLFSNGPTAPVPSPLQSSQALSSKHPLPWYMAEPGSSSFNLPIDGPHFTPRLPGNTFGGGYPFYDQDGNYRGGFTPPPQQFPQSTNAFPSIPVDSSSLYRFYGQAQLYAPAIHEPNPVPNFYPAAPSASHYQPQPPQLQQQQNYQLPQQGEAQVTAAMNIAPHFTNVPPSASSSVSPPPSLLPVSGQTYIGEPSTATDSHISPLASSSITKLKPKAWGVGSDMRPVSKLFKKTNGPPSSSSSQHSQSPPSQLLNIMHNSSSTSSSTLLESNPSDPGAGSDEFVVIPTGSTGPFPPGLGLARIAAAGHTIVRLEVVHKAAAMAISAKSKPGARALPFCSCGLLSGVYTFLLLALATQAQCKFQLGSKQKEEIQGMYTNAKILIAGLNSYGEIWEGIGKMGDSAQKALDACMSLSDDLVASAALQAKLLEEMEDEEDDYDDSDELKQ